MGVVLLIAAGALVKSREAGLAVPDWPLSYGTLNPPRWWEIANVRAEHGHRLIAGTVALLTVGLAWMLQRREPRRWVRRLGWVAVAAVLAQAALGGLTVLFFLPKVISISHAALAEIYLCLITTLAVATSAAWRGMEPVATSAAAGAARAWAGARALVGMVFVQILLGAVVRHFGAGLAIPDFPLVFGGLLPPHWTLDVTLHFAHRVGAVLVAVLAVRAFVAARKGLGAGSPARRALALVLGLVAIQIGLGGAVVLTGRAVVPNTVHVAVGATVLATAWTGALFAGRAAGRWRSS